MIEAGLQLMVMGMGVVFVFLIILVALMSLMSVITRRFENPVPETAGEVPPTGTHDDAHIPAVLAAVAQHHRRRSSTTTTHTSGDHT
ncbi:MAG: OadG family protein [Alkalispirochaeta sp.]